MSFLEDLEIVHERVRRASVKDLPVPGSARALWVRFRPPPDRDRLTPVITEYKMNGALSAEQELQLIVDCGQEVLRRGPDGKLESYDPPLHFDGGDERWGDDVKTARQCVAKLYNLDLQTLAAAGVADSLVDWLQGVDAEAAARVEGESAAGAAS